MVTPSLFLLGFVVGGLALNTYNLWVVGSKQPTKQERYQKAFDQLNLNEGQKIEVQRIVAEIRGNIQQLRREPEPQMQEIRARNNVRLESVSTVEQWTKFQRLREAIRQSEPNILRIKYF